MSKIIKYNAEKHAFAEHLLPLLRNIDFELTAENRAAVHDYDTIVAHGGKFYRILWSYFPNLLEILVHAHSVDPRLPRYAPHIEEFCFVYSNYPKPFRSTEHWSSYVIDKYFISGYQKMQRLQQRCFYCDCRLHTPNAKAHERTKKHKSNRARLESELAAAAKLPLDCMLQILSYL